MFNDLPGPPSEAGSLGPHNISDIEARGGVTSHVHTVGKTLERDTNQQRESVCIVVSISTEALFYWSIIRGRFTPS